MQMMLERLERERDTARADVERLIDERDALRERLKVQRRDRPLFSIKSNWLNIIPFLL